MVSACRITSPVRTAVLCATLVNTQTHRQTAFDLLYYIGETVQLNSRCSVIQLEVSFLFFFVFFSSHCIAFHFLYCIVLFCCTVHHCLFNFLIFSLLATSSIKVNLNLRVKASQCQFDCFQKLQYDVL